MNPEDNPAQNDVYFEKLVGARAHLPLPGQSDFCLVLDGEAGNAWRNFGGLSLDAASQKFFESPEILQEDFMWMFPRAFEYYYPVVDHYLRTVRASHDDYRFEDGCQAWILGHCLKSQFHWADGSRPPDYVVSEIRALAHYVRDHLPRFSSEPSEQERIDLCWAELQDTLTDIG